MRLTKIIPKIFYSDINTGLKLFIEYLGFEVAYHETQPRPFYIVNRDGITLYLVEDDEFAQKDRPEIRIETDDIETLYKEVTGKTAKLLYPNLIQIKKQPWGLKEFALRDESNVCVIIQQPVADE